MTLIKKDWIPFEEAKKYVQTHSDAKTREEYIKWHITEKPKGIPRKHVSKSASIIKAFCKYVMPLSSEIPS